MEKIEYDSGLEGIEVDYDVSTKETLRQLMKTTEEPKGFTYIPKGGDYVNTIRQR